MDNELYNYLEKARGNSSILSYSEDAAKQTIILPILQKLGWDIFNVDEVTPEYTVQSNRVDYSLRINDRNLIFLEAKRPGRDLEDHQEQLLNYSFQVGVKMAILTNGVIWWFYLPLREGSWNQRKFYSIDIQQKDLKEIQQKFTAFVSKDAINTGKALKNAESIFDSRFKAKAIKSALPKAWNALVTEPDEFLIELLKDKVENISGYVPSIEDLETFFDENISKIKLSGDLEKSSTQKTKSRSLDKPRSTNEPENKVSQQELVPIIVEVLKDLDGRSDKQTVEEKIFKRFGDTFEGDWYQEMVANGVPRWKHNIAWAKEHAKHDGLIKPPSESGRGIWELTDKAYGKDGVAL